MAFYRWGTQPDVPKYPFEFRGPARWDPNMTVTISGHAHTYNRARLIEQADDATHARLIAQAENDEAAEHVLNHYKGC